MKWIKASERSPDPRPEMDNNREYCFHCRCDGKRLVLYFWSFNWWGERYDGEIYGISEKQFNKLEWLDESPSSLPDQGELYRVDENGLLPCPFCGAKPEINFVGRNGVEIKCPSCVIKYKQKTIRHHTDWLKEKMKETWNKRKAETPAGNQDELWEEFSTDWYDQKMTTSKMKSKYTLIKKQ